MVTLLGTLPLSIEGMMWRQRGVPPGFCQVTWALSFRESGLFFFASSVGLPHIELPWLRLGRICNWKIPSLLLIENLCKSTEYIENVI
jgi:hypothetical protein